MSERRVAYELAADPIRQRAKQTRAALKYMAPYRRNLLLLGTLLVIAALVAVTGYHASPDIMVGAVGLQFFLGSAAVLTVVRAYLGIYSVKDYGATGNGVADDRPGAAAAHLAAEAVGGGTVLYPAGTYLLDTTGPIPITADRSGNGVLCISGYGATIKIGMSGVTARGFLKFKGSGNSAVSSGSFKNLVVEGFRVDFNAQTSRGAAILGNSNSPDLPYHADYANIVIRDVYSYNIPTAASGGQAAHVYITSRHAGASESLNTINNVFCKNVLMEGGVHGIFVGGQADAGSACEVKYDNIVFEDCLHDYLATYTAATGSNFQVGQHAYGGRVQMVRCEGRYGNDSSFEVNSFQNLLYRDCVVKDPRNCGFYWRNFHAPTNANTQTVTVEGCRVLIENVIPSYPNYPCRGIQGGPLATDIHGQVTIRDYVCRITTAMTYGGTSGSQNDHQGHGIFIGPGSQKLLTLENIHIEETGIVMDATSGGTRSPVFIQVQNAENQRVKIDGLYVKQAGTKSASPGSFNYAAYAIGAQGSTADLTLDIQNVDAEFGLPSDGAYAWFLGLIGHISGQITTARGRLGRHRVISGTATAGGSFGVRFGGSDRLAIDGQIVVESSDFSTIGSSNNEIVFLSGASSRSNAHKVIARDVRLRSASTLAGAAPIAVSLQGTLNTTNTSNSATSAAGATFQVGQLITGTGIPANTYIGAISGSTLTLTTSNLSTASNATATNTGTTVTLDRYHNLDNILQLFRVSGGTVTDIQHSRDSAYSTNAVWAGGSLGITAGLVALEPGHAIQIVRSAEPTMSKTLQR
jgi:hypothetical protein